MRFRVDPGDVSPEKAARRMGLLLAEFELHLPKLLSRGFPPADVTTGNYDLDAINAWRRRRNPHLFPQQGQADGSGTPTLGWPGPGELRDAREPGLIAGRIERMRAEAPTKRGTRT